LVTRQAMPARASAVSPEPPLKPNQPTHKKTVPNTTCVTLWGR
jgi:hypothetical protein